MRLDPQANSDGQHQSVQTRHDISLLKFVGARFVHALGTMLGASVLIWALLPLAPGDTALRTLQARGIDEPRPFEVAAVREELGLYGSLIIQCFRWLGRATQGDFSNSYVSGQPVSTEIGKRLSATTLLAGAALLFSILLAISAALIEAAYFQKWPDRALGILTQAGASMPGFLLGLLVLQGIVGGISWGQVVSRGSLSEVWLPAFCLSVGRAAEWAQLLRANLIEAMNRSYTLVAMARGATKWGALWRFALPNAALPFLTVVGVGIGSLLGGAAIIETVFTWPGIGSYVVASLTARDLPGVQAFVILSALTYVGTRVLVDVASTLIDPRLLASKTG